MEVDNTYYRRIVYKKNAFEDLKTYIKLNYANKKLLLISTKTVAAEDVTAVFNSLICGTASVDHFVARSNFCTREVEKISARVQATSYDLLVVLGAGRACDVVKYLAYKKAIPYIVCPTLATSMAYFTNFCINPYDSSKSFYAKMPNKIFIQESIIKNSSCYTNINGLCCLNALRSVYVEGIIANEEKEQHVFVGLEKLINKLDEEYTNILLCGEDANLILMDLFIDFGFFMAMLDKENFYLINMYCLYNSFNNDNVEAFSGRKLLVCSKLILSALKKYLDINSFNNFEKPNFEKIAKIIKKYKLNEKKFKNIKFFSNFSKKMYIKRCLSENASEIYKVICGQIYKINSFCKKVKSVYKFGIEIEEDYEKLMHSLALSPFIYKANSLVNLMAGSGVLNALI